MPKKGLSHTITIRASQEFKDKLQTLANDISKQVDGEIRISDLVRLGLDWVLMQKPEKIVDFLVGEEVNIE